MDFYKFGELKGPRDFMALNRAQIFGLLFTLALFYYFSISIVIPNFIEVKKFRNKKLTKNITSITTMMLEGINNKKLINNSYKKFIQ